MNWQQAVLSVSVGAVIGYITNWIAIRMLFRPLHEKKFLGLPVPFTPGVIPRGKKRLAGSIGDVVGGMLLTEEKVVQHLLQPEVEEQVRRHLAARLQKWRDREATLGDVLAEAGGKAGSREEVTRLFTGLAVNVVQSEELRRAAAGALARAAARLAERPVGPFVDSGSFTGAREVLERLLAGILSGEKPGEGLQRQLALKIERLLNSPAPIGSYLPGAVREGIHQFVTDQAPRIIAALEQYLTSPGARRAMKNRIENFFEGTAVKRLLNGVFQLMGTGPDMLAQRLAAEITRFFADEHNRGELLERLHMLVDELLDKSIAEITAGLDAAGKREKAGEIAAWLAEKLGDPGFMAGLLDVVEEILTQHRRRSWRELLGLEKEACRARVEELCQGLMARLARREEAEQYVRSLVQRLVDRLWQVKVSRVLCLLPAGAEGDPGIAVTRLYRWVVREQVPGLLRFLDISGMVRQRVEELDVLQVEEMLLGIMRRELVAITWLGALLGAVLGLVLAGMQQVLK